MTVTVYNISYSLNAETRIAANSYEEAEKKLRDELKDKGINLEDKFFLEVFDVVEEEEK